MGAEKNDIIMGGSKWKTVRLVNAMDMGTSPLDPRQYGQQEKSPGAEKEMWMMTPLSMLAAGHSGRKAHRWYLPMALIGRVSAVCLQCASLLQSSGSWHVQKHKTADG